MRRHSKRKGYSENIDITKAKTDKQKERLKERAQKLELAIKLTETTKDYNLGTSLRNYIDPRVFKAWTDEVKADWEKLYTTSLQRKFLWVKNINTSWKEIMAQ